ncbi:unnamed protein product [Sphagnum compactum]
MPEGPPNNQVLCGTFNADGTLFVTGSSDKMARVWDACKWNDDRMGRPNYELDTLKGYGNDVNNVQFRLNGQGGKVAKGLSIANTPPPMSPHEPPQGNGPPHHVPLGVNMIVWSLDTCFILAATVDHRICMWNAVDGSLVHSLTGHEKSLYLPTLGNLFGLDQDQD